MLGILVDAVVLIFVLAFMRKGETEGFGRLLLGCAIMAGLNYGVAFAGAAMEMGPLILGVMMLVDALFLKSWCGLTWPKALLAVAILFAIKIPLALALQR